MSDAIGPGEAARRLGVSTRTVQRWLREGRLDGVRVGSRLKVDPRSLPPAEPETVSGAAAPARPIQRLLVANRGELVVRIGRTCRRLGVHLLALVPGDQAKAWWTNAADELVPLRGTYLDAEAVLDAAVAAQADAIHPGYGFLAENADFAAAVIERGLVWVGPPPAAMRALGDKAAARRLAQAVGIKVLTGYDGAGQSEATLARAARKIGLPLLIKPSAGGGGMGMHVVRRESELPAALAQARREARAAFGNDRLILERHLAAPRHVEVQVLCDAHGGRVHLGERECSLQRRHQKVIEEAPSVAVSPELRDRLGEQALRLCAEAGYVGAGTAEFLLDGEGRAYFLELNARLQVEHPVTELITGRDLVSDQLRIAAGERLGFAQSDVRFAGHAIEARLYAEDPNAEFLPAVGDVVAVEWSGGEDLRVDAGVGAGDVIGTRYDPLLAKILAHGPDRVAALERLRGALERTAVLGVTTNRGFLRWLLELPAVAAGETHTELIGDAWHPAGTEVPDEAWAVAAGAFAAGASVGDRAGFRLNAAPRLRLEIEGEQRSVTPAAQTSPPVRWLDTAGGVVLDYNGRAVHARLAPPPTVETAARGATHLGAGAQVVRAPMPGSVIDVRVAEGDEVAAGQVLLVLEAMKMENGVPAPAPARVTRVLVQAGEQVQRNDPLVELA